MSPELFGHLGYGLIALAYLVRGMLWLRLIAIGASLAIIAFSLISPDGLSPVTFWWNVAFIFINAIHCVVLVHERLASRLNPEEARLRRSVFPAIDPVVLKRLLRPVEWGDLPAGTVLAREGMSDIDLTLIVDGSAAVESKDREVATLSGGQFVGEMSLLTGNPASATVTVSTPMRMIRWNKKALADVNTDELRAVLHAAIGADMANKLARGNRTEMGSRARGGPALGVEQRG